MATLSTQFEQALSRIEIHEPQATRTQEAHREVREHLQNSQLSSWGVETVLIGSYGRQVSTHPGKDVDVFAKMTSLNRSAEPEEVFNSVSDVLTGIYGDRATPGNRSIAVAFSADGFAVDVVPAVRAGDKWAIPVQDRELWSSTEEERWLETNPELLTELTHRRNQSVLVNGRGAYVPVIKLVRQTRQHHRGERGPSGLFFELITYWAFDSIRGDSIAELYSLALAAIVHHLTSAEILRDPSIDAAFEPQIGTAERQSAIETFRPLVEKSRAALDADPCPAAALWREVLGQRTDGAIVFPLPPGCDEHGNRMEPIFPNEASGSEEPRGFARNCN